jgi:hypothetical protein
MKKVLLSLLLLLSAGCAGPTEPPPSSIAPIDSSKVLAAQENLKTDAELAGCLIKCSAQNNLLVMTGKVNNEAAKARAEVLVKKVQGIKNVANHLEVVAQSSNLPAGEAAPP